MKHLKTLQDFSTDSDNALNEGFFDSLLSAFKSIVNYFKSPDTLRKSLEVAATEMGQKATKFVSKDIKPNDTIFVIMGDGKNSANDFSLAMSKLADFPDGSGIFQVTGTTNVAMLKTLVGTDSMDDLAKNSIMAIVPPFGLTKGKPATLKMLKSMTPPGKNYVSNTLVQSIVPSSFVNDAMKKII